MYIIRNRLLLIENENLITLLGEITVQDIRYCPEMSRDANGSAGTTGLRFYLM